MGRTRLTLREAAQVLGVSKEAVRKRALRGTLRSERDPDGRVYVYVDAGQDEPPTHERDALISQLRDEISYLRDESRRKDEIIMQQALTVRQLTAPAGEPRESPETAAEGTMEPTPSEPSRSPQEGSERPEERSWWRRVFGG